MKKISLTSNKFTLIDDVDFDKINKYKWYFDGRYAYKNFYNKILKKTLPFGLHRYILNLKRKDGKEVDHINGNKLDNRRCNLRICTKSENKQNRNLKTNTSGYNGVRKKRNKWETKIIKNYKYYHIGIYDDPELAAIAYDLTAIGLYGFNAKTNIINLRD